MIEKTIISKKTNSKTNEKETLSLLPRQDLQAPTPTPPRPLCRLLNEKKKEQPRLKTIYFLMNIF